MKFKLNSAQFESIARSNLARAAPPFLTTSTLSDNDWAGLEISAYFSPVPGCGLAEIKTNLGIGLQRIEHYISSILRVNGYDKK